MTRNIYYILALLIGSWLTACGTDSGSGSSSGSNEGISTPVTITQAGGLVNKSSISLRLTDAPIDGLVRVVIEFTGVELKQSGSGWIRYDLAKPLSVDLLQLQGAITADLLSNVPVSAGTYKELRLFTSSGSAAHFVKENSGGIKPLQLPGGSGAGLKILKDFTITEDQASSLIIDFDLRRSVRSPGKSGKYQFFPVMNLISAASAGNLSGMVDSALLTAGSCSDPLVDTYNAVYVYSGHNVVPDDIDSANNNVEPVATTTVNYDATTNKYVYTAAFLPAGDYTTAVTCNADAENLNTSDNLQFFNIQNVTVLANDPTFL
jgi:hypothetical protein